MPYYTLVFKSYIMVTTTVELLSSTTPTISYHRPAALLESVDYPPPPKLLLATEQPIPLKHKNMARVNEMTHINFETLTR
jgi:hypothetical protein